MSNTTSTAPVNVKKLVIWSYENSAESAKILDLEGRLMGYKDTLTSNSTNLNGDGKVTDVAYGVSGGTLELDIHELTDTERTAIYGEKQVKGANVTTDSDNPPYVAVALIVERNDGTVNLHKWFKVKFTPNDENVVQISDGKKTYSTISLQGTYIDNGTVGYRASRRRLNPTTDANIITQWTTNADYIGETE